MCRHDHQPRTTRRTAVARITATLAGWLVVPRFLGRDAARASGPADGVALCPTRDCGYEYDPSIGDPDHGIPPGIAFDDLPADWICPNCARPKAQW